MNGAIPPAMMDEAMAGINKRPTCLAGIKENSSRMEGVGPLGGWEWTESFGRSGSVSECSNLISEHVEER
jgi:hypothetical protein